MTSHIIHPNHIRPWPAKIPVGRTIRFRCGRLEDGRYLLELEGYALEAKP